MSIMDYIDKALRQILEYPQAYGALFILVLSGLTGALESKLDVRDFFDNQIGKVGLQLIFVGYAILFAAFIDKDSYFSHRYDGDGTTQLFGFVWVFLTMVYVFAYLICRRLKLAAEKAGTPQWKGIRYFHEYFFSKWVLLTLINLSVGLISLSAAVFFAATPPVEGPTLLEPLETI